MKDYGRLQEPTVQSVQIEDIDVPKGRREHTPEQVGALAESMAQLGQLQPIGLTENYRLIFGAGRLAACKALGPATVRAEIHPLEGLEAELAEIHENVRRSSLTPTEEGRALKRAQGLNLGSLAISLSHSKEYALASVIGHLDGEEEC